MADTEPSVYLEDVQVTTTVKEVKPSDTVAVVTTAAVKRQRTLVDMFSTAQRNEPVAKKQKLTVSASLSLGSSSQATRVTSLGIQSSNSIPFSISSFQESLSDEQKDLLKLECEVMGESWQVDQT